MFNAKINGLTSILNLNHCQTVELKSCVNKQVRKKCWACLSSASAKSLGVSRKASFVFYMKVLNPNAFDSVQINRQVCFTGQIWQAFLHQNWVGCVKLGHLRISKQIFIWGLFEEVNKVSFTRYRTIKILAQ